MEHYTYILYSKSRDIFYKGSTKDVYSRLLRHNSGREKFTSKGKPWLLIWYTLKPNKAQAYRLELKLKNLSKNRLIDFMIKYQDDIVGSDELLLIKQLSECWHIRQHSSPVQTANNWEADYVFLVAPWWDPAVEEQAIDRCYRIGQDKKVFGYRMICKDTIEVKIIQLQSKKKKKQSHQMQHRR